MCSSLPKAHFKVESILNFEVGQIRAPKWARSICQIQILSCDGFIRPPAARQLTSGDNFWRQLLTPYPKEKRAALLCLQENIAMKKSAPSRSDSDLIALVDAIIAYWKSIAELRFKEANPNSDPAEFERQWLKTLDNFFLAETVRTANAIRFLSESREN
jgi:hypothetical protein